MTDERVYFHVVFNVTDRKPVFINDEIDAAFKQLALEIANQRGWNLLELETMPNHVHLLLEKAPDDSLSSMIGYLKGRTAHDLLEQFAWLRGDLNSDHLWKRGFYNTRHTTKSLATVRSYIRNQRRVGGLAE